MKKLLEFLFTTLRFLKIFLLNKINHYQRNAGKNGCGRNNH